MIHVAALHTRLDHPVVVLRKRDSMVDQATLVVLSRSGRGRRAGPSYSIETRDCRVELAVLVKLEQLN